ncbi:MAG TPA: FG-GAP-like repeat-containing protein [Bryobacteraceae bacterium]|jgi:hypothetical protein|nr:FG-GAP-like repeat-containing protein [Bryobacteraceae bacterium]
MFLFSLIFFASPGWAQNPAPHIDILSPAAIAPGRGQDLPLKIKGTGFAPGAQVNFNGTNLTPASITSTDITVMIPAANLDAAQTANVTVVNPNTAPAIGASNVVFFPIVNATASVTTNLTTVGMDNEPFSVVVGDFNGDGKPDIATANNCANLSACGSAGNVTILLNDGRGNFFAAPAFSSSVDAVAIASGDFNGDGRLDLAIADSCINRSSCTPTGAVTILLGDGTGSFSPVSSPIVDDQPSSIAVGDFNGDGNLDLGVGGQSGTVTILLGDGTGQFSAASSFRGGDSIAVGDFNEDGNLDLIAGSTLLLGDGAGNFIATYNTGAQAGAVGDFNGDGHLDIAATSSGSVLILLGDGKGNFVQTASVPVGLNPGQVTIGDVNGDGRLDLVVANQAASESNYTVGSASVLLGDGTGNFGLASSPSVTFGARSVALGDFDGDGKLDMAVASWNFLISVLSQPRASEIGIPSTLDFGAQNLNANITLPLTITNTGRMTLNVTAVVVQPGTNAGTNDFTAQLNTCASGVQPGASCSLSISFTPSMVGPESAMLTVTDDSGTGMQTVTLTGTGVQPFDNAISVTLSSTQLTYPGATNVIVAVAGSDNARVTGTVTLFDGAAALITLPLNGNGKAHWYISPGLAVGAHQISAAYSGDANNAAGKSAPVAVTVSPAPVHLSASCGKASLAYGQNYSCTVTVGSNAGAPSGVIIYAVDSSAAAVIALTDGTAQFTLNSPVVGSHTVSIQFAQQGNFAASAVKSRSFTVTPARVSESVTASSYSAHEGTPITLSAVLSSESAGAPNAQGTVSFYDGSTLLGTVPVSSDGTASFTTGDLAIGRHLIRASYSGSAQYASATASIRLTISQ